MRTKPRSDKGGPGSGHHGHAGRPRERGGSLPAGMTGESMPEGMTGAERTQWYIDQGYDIVDYTGTRQGTNKPYENRPAFIDDDFDPDIDSMGIGWRDIDDEYEDYIQGIIDDFGIPYDHTDLLIFTDKPPRGYKFDNANGYASISGRDHDLGGRYNALTKVINVRKGVSAGTVLHEIGHHVDHTYGFRGSAGWMKGFRKFKADTADLSSTEISELTGLRTYSRAFIGEFFADCYMMMASGQAKEKHLFKLTEYIGRDAYAIFDALFEDAR